MSLDFVIETIQRRAPTAGFGHTAKLDFGDDGIVYFDDTQKPAVVNNDDKDAEVTLICDLGLFEGFLTGDQDPNVSFMMGKLKIEGSMGLALKLNTILEE